MKVHSAFALLSALSIITISPASAALRGNGNGNGNANGNGNGGIFDGTSNGNGNGNDNGNDNGQGNGEDKGYNDMVNDVKISLENGESLGEAKVKQLKQKYKQEKLKVNGKKSKLFQSS